MNKKKQNIWFVVLVNYLMLIVVSLVCSCNFLPGYYDQEVTGDLEVMVALPNTASNYTITRQFVYKCTTDNYEKMYPQSQSWVDSKIATNPEIVDAAALSTVLKDTEYTLYRSQTWLYPETVQTVSSDKWEVTVIFSMYDSDQVLYSDFTEEIQPIEMSSVSFVFPQEEGSGYLSNNMVTKTFGSVIVSLSYATEYVEYDE